MNAKKTTGKGLAALLLCLCLFLSAGTIPAAAAVPPVSVTREYAEETVLYGEAVCPTLLPGASDGTVVVRWIARSRKPVTLHYAPDDGSGVLPARHETQRLTPTLSRFFSGAIRLWLYAAQLEVEPGTDYLYGLSEDDSDPARLYSYAAPEGELTALLTADPHVANAAHARLWNEAAEQAAAREDYSLILCAGDINENSETEPFVLTANAPVTRSVPLAVVVGCRDYYQSLYEYFTMPNTDDDTRDYWFVKGNTLFMGLNIGCEDTEAHADFLRAAVEENEDCRWRVVMLHFSLWSNGSHGRDALVMHFQRELTPVFSETDIALVVSGHDHEYDRSPLIRGEGEALAGEGDELRRRPGEVLFLSLPATTEAGSPAETTSEATSGYALAEFGEETVTVRVYEAEKGLLVDSFTLEDAPAYVTSRQKKSPDRRP